MQTYKVYVETKGPVNQYHTELMRIGHRHSCVIRPDAEFTCDNKTDYRVAEFNPKVASKKGNALVEELRTLDFVVSAEVANTKKLN